MDNQQVSTLLEIPELKGYFCDLNGNIFSSVRGKLRQLKPHLHKGRGSKLYLRCKIGATKLYLVHRLVAAVKVGRLLHAEEQVNHINADTQDNRLDNLEVCTQSENVRHAVENRLYCEGQDWYVARGKTPTTNRKV